jgi:hypothetical protein
MQTHGRMESKKMRAAEALKAALTHVSGVKLRNIEVEPLRSEQNIDIVAHIEIYGHSHTLACILLPNEKPEQVRQTVAGFCDRTLKVAGNATPVLIAPKSSAYLQKLCRESRAGMLDLAGNARIELGDVFIACHHVVARSDAHQRAARERALKGPAHGGAAA